MVPTLFIKQLSLSVPGQTDGGQVSHGEEGGSDGGGGGEEDSLSRRRADEFEETTMAEGDGKGGGGRVCSAMPPSKQ